VLDVVVAGLAGRGRRGGVWLRQPEWTMSIHPLFGANGFLPEDITIMSAALDGAMDALGLTDRDDLRVETLASRILALAQGGERDPDRLRDLALLSVGK
jgi:hypothetical protein